MRAELRRLGVGCVVVLAAGCATRQPPRPSDDLLAERVRAALVGASDVPGSQLTVRVDNGVVLLGGSFDCADCGGQATPGGTGTVEQSIGAIVRAVPGVLGVRFQTGSDP